MRGNKQILLNDRGDEQSAYLLALEDFCLLPVRDYIFDLGGVSDCDLKSE